MKIFLNGYMGSGKSLIGLEIAKKLQYHYIDLDRQIEIIEGTTIHNIFQKRGELYFRRLERKILQDILENSSSLVVSLGGGTPCYGDNLDLIKKQESNKTVYLKASVETLTERLFYEKAHRPVISHLETRPALEEFIRKHLFERAFYYNQSQISITIDHKKSTEIVSEILEKLK